MFFERYQNSDRKKKRAAHKPLAYAIKALKPVKFSGRRIMENENHAAAHLVAKEDKEDKEDKMKHLSLKLRKLPASA